MVGFLRGVLSAFAVAVLLAATPAQSYEVRNIAFTTTPGGEHVTMRLSDDAEVEVWLATQSPPRVVIDMPLAHWKDRKNRYSSTLVKAVRMGYHDEDSSRMVLDLKAPVRLENVRMEGNERKGYLLEFDIYSTTPAPDRNTTNKKPSQQFQPREKPTIVIDAGHGGQDPGTSGVGGMEEKRITLAFAHALEKELLSRRSYRVVLTRKDDRYLFLRDRVKRAREAGGSLFISLHADSAPSRAAHGLSVYTISEKASDKEAEALAAKENKADVIGGMNLSTTSQDVADILIDLAERETRGKSAQFARLIVRRLAHDVPLLSNTHRFAGFAVLKAPDIPSVLVELGFLSSRREEKLLESDGYRQKVVRGIADAVEGYFSKARKR